MPKENENKSKMPLLIIGLVLVGAVVGGIIWVNTSKSTVSNANANRTPTAGNTVKSSNIPADAPAGATPPNMAGSPAATVTLEEFADFQCGSCAASFPVLNEVKGMYGSRIKFIFRNFPLKIPAHDKSYDAAVAAEAAGMQNKFWEMHAQLFQNQQLWTANPNYKQMWAEYAQKIGLNVAKWQDDCAGLAAKGRVEEDMKRGNAIGVNSTPTIFLNGVSVPYPSVNVTTLKQMIDAEIAKAAAPAANAPAQNAPAANAAASNKGSNK